MNFFSTAWKLLEVLLESEGIFFAMFLIFDESNRWKNELFGWKNVWSKSKLHFFVLFYYKKWQKAVEQPKKHPAYPVEWAAYCWIAHNCYRLSSSAFVVYFWSYVYHYKEETDKWRQIIQVMFELMSQVLPVLFLEYKKCCKKMYLWRGGAVWPIWYNREQLVAKLRMFWVFFERVLIESTKPYWIFHSILSRDTVLHLVSFFMKRFFVIFERKFQNWWKQSNMIDWTSALKQIPYS